MGENLSEKISESYFFSQTFAKQKQGFRRLLEGWRHVGIVIMLDVMDMVAIIAPF